MRVKAGPLQAEAVGKPEFVPLSSRMQVGRSVSTVVRVSSNNFQLFATDPPDDRSSFRDTAVDIAPPIPPTRSV